MTDKSTLIDEITFESPIEKSNSYASWTLSEKAKSKMSLYFNKDDTGYIEWEIEELDEYNDIGLTFEFDVAGKRTLVDYDGIFALPKVALDLLEKNGVDVKDMRSSLSK